MTTWRRRSSRRRQLVCAFPHARARTRTHTRARRARTPAHAHARTPRTPSVDGARALAHRPPPPPPPPPPRRGAPTPRQARPTPGTPPRRTARCGDACAAAVRDRRRSRATAGGAAADGASATSTHRARQRARARARQDARQGVLYVARACRRRVVHSRAGTAGDQSITPTDARALTRDRAQSLDATVGAAQGGAPRQEGRRHDADEGRFCGE